MLLRGIPHANQIRKPNVLVSLLHESAFLVIQVKKRQRKFLNGQKRRPLPGTIYLELDPRLIGSRTVWDIEQKYMNFSPLNPSSFVQETTTYWSNSNLN